MFVLVATFALERLVVSAVAEAGIHAYFATRSGVAGLVVQLASPLLHTSGTHLAGNLLLLVPLALLFARHTSLSEFAAGLYGFGLVANQVVPMAVELAGDEVALAVGASGVTFALAAHEALLRSWWLLTGRHRGREPAALALVAVAVGLERGATLLTGPAADGVSHLAHVAGFGTGAAVAVLTALGTWLADRRGHQ